MKMLRRRGSPAPRQISEGLAALDAEVFEAIAKSPTPILDKTMPALTRAADHAKLWLAIAARRLCRLDGAACSSRQDG
jgi:hypothetical protein